MSSRFTTQEIRDGHASSAIKALLETVGPRIREEVARAYDPSSTMGKPESLIMLIADGTSPIAPSEIRKIGAKGVSTGVAIRSSLAEILKTNPLFAPMLERIRTPAKCGHLEFLASTRAGNLIQCTQCDLGVQPDGTTLGNDRTAEA